MLECEFIFVDVVGWMCKCMTAGGAISSMVLCSTLEDTDQRPSLGG